MHWEGIAEKRGSMPFAAGGRRVAGGPRRGAVRCWLIPSGGRAHRSTIGPGHPYPAFSLERGLCPREIVQQEVDMQRIEHAMIATPLGSVALAAAGETLVVLRFTESFDALRPQLEGRFREWCFRATSDPGGHASRVRHYFAGNLGAFEDAALEPGGTPFQRAAWAALRRIPAGTTRSYAEQALALGAPRAVRAVGLANACNPIALAIPCHRVIGSDGRLTGFAAGLDRKRWLLQHERAIAR